MFEWHETSSGNYVTEDEESVKITVFTDKNGAWRGIREEHITDDGYESAEEAIKAIEDIAAGLYDHLSRHVCHCNMSKCKCGHDDLLEMYTDYVEGRYADYAEGNFSQNER